MLSFPRSKRPDPALAQLRSRLDSLEANCLTSLEQGLADMAAGTLTTGAEAVTRPIDLHFEDPRVARSSAKMQGDMDDIVSVAQQSTAATEQVPASTRQTFASAQEIATGAQDLARRADTLADLVATFRVA